jgi:polysaccharide deacetylase family protein (PEP-CTERM system associated)
VTSRCRFTFNSYSIRKDEQEVLDMDAPIILSFDVEEHYRIEAAAALQCPIPLREEYSRRVDSATRRLLDLLAAHQARATFFVVGDIAQAQPRLVRDIAAAGHEIASHGWDHRRVHCFSRDEFLEDVRNSKDVLEQVTGAAVQGYRAPTFSIDRQTGWAIDALVEAGFIYDSSIFPVRHDRYGIPDAPRTPFIAVGAQARLLELPPTTLRLSRFNLPVAGGGYFRLFPLRLLEAGTRQVRNLRPAAAMLYFHPWEFDVDQPRLPLSRLARWRTYVGIKSASRRLALLLSRHRFTRAIDVVGELTSQPLPEFQVWKNALCPV